MVIGDFAPHHLASVIFSIELKNLQVFSTFGKIEKDF